MRKGGAAGAPRAAWQARRARAGARTIQPSGMASAETIWVLASGANLSATTTSVGSSSSTPCQHEVMVLAVFLNFLKFSTSEMMRALGGA
jgi:hypothetical protein